MDGREEGSALAVMLLGKGWLAGIHFHGEARRPLAVAQHAHQKDKLALPVRAGLPVDRS